MIRLEQIRAELDRALDLWERRLTTFAAVVRLAEELESHEELHKHG